MRVIVVTQPCKTQSDLREMPVSELQRNKLQGFGFIYSFQWQYTHPSLFAGVRQDTKRKAKTRKNKLPPQEQYFSIFIAFFFPLQQKCDRSCFFLSFQVTVLLAVCLEELLELWNSSDAPINCTVRVMYFDYWWPREFAKLRNTNPRKAMDECIMRKVWWLKMRL